jgi:hypothetical protein
MSVLYLPENNSKMKCSLLFLILIGCSPYTRVRVDRDIDFGSTHYTSYSWCTAPPAPELSVAIRDNFPGDEQIKAAVNRVMLKKGYILSDTCATLELHYHVIVDDKDMAITSTYDYERTSVWIRSDEDGQMYADGTWILDLVDSQTGHHVWRSRAQAFFKKVHSKTLQRQVGKVMKDLPQASGEHHNDVHKKLR